MLLVALSALSLLSAQNTYYFQGFESTSVCPENWGYIGGEQTTRTARTGANSLLVGRGTDGANSCPGPAGSPAATFDWVNVENLTNPILQIYHRIGQTGLTNASNCGSGSGEGLDTREGAVVQVAYNNSTNWITIGQVGGNSNHNYAWSAPIGGTTNTCPQTFTMPNPLIHTIPAGTISIRFRVLSIASSNTSSSCNAACRCSEFSSTMNAINPTPANYDRWDEGFYIDDVSVIADAPVFDIPITTYCQGATIPALPPTSINGINGSWSPGINNNSTTTYQFVPNNGGCPAGSQTLTITPAPAQPTGLACYEIATFNPASCEWEITGTMPTEPNATNCWDDYQFDNASCSWTNNGTQSMEPNPTNCWDDYGFDNATCSWVNNGTQPTQPVIACYETAIFNSGNCSWDVTGTQPTQPNAINCWDDYQFNPTSCSWVNNGTQPTQPVIACYETATFNSGSCTWNVSGTLPAQPIAINCWDEYQFDNTQCSWVNNGVQQAEPNDLACYETTTFDTTSCSWIITGDVSNALLDVLVSPSLAEINVGQEVQLNTESTPNITNLSYTWTPALGLSCSDCANPIASPSATTTYTVFVIDQNGCQASANATVMVSENCPDLFFPTMFSPNSDGNNDYFCAFGGCISSISLKIYNRWGEVIFNASDVSECWDGKHLGKFVNNGAYVYKAQVSQTNGEPRLFSGIVTVVR